MPISLQNGIDVSYFKTNLCVLLFILIHDSQASMPFAFSPQCCCHASPYCLVVIKYQPNQIKPLQSVINDLSFIFFFSSDHLLAAKIVE